MSADVKGDTYKGLLEKNTQGTKSGAGRCFTTLRLLHTNPHKCEPTKY